MIILMDGHMKKMKDELTERGYIVYESGETAVIPDVYLYYEASAEPENNNLSLHSKLNMNEEYASNELTINERNPDFFGSFKPNSEGTLLINGYKKSIDEVVNAIENRLYSPLF